MKAHSMHTRGIIRECDPCCFVSRLGSGALRRYSSYSQFRRSQELDIKARPVHERERHSIPSLLIVPTFDGAMSPVLKVRIYFSEYGRDIGWRSLEVHTFMYAPEQQSGDT